MKTRIKSIISTIMSAALCMTFSPFSSSHAVSSTSEYLSEILSPDYYNQEIDWDLWDRFLKYDLCITDYDALTAEQQELCKFIFETERSASGTVRCERARRTLAGDDVGERITFEQLENSYGVLDPAYHDVVCKNTLTLVADIEHLDYNSSVKEYWLDDTGTYRVITGTEGNNFIYIEQCEDSQDYTITKIPYSDYIEIESVEFEDVTYKVLYDNTAIYCANLGDYSEEEIPVSIVIPEVIENYPIVSVDGFSGTNVASVQFPETLKKISDLAFAYCEYLTKIAINCPNGVIGKMSFQSSALKTADITAKTIDEEAFSECASLESAALNEGLESLEANAFKNCTSLTSVKIPSTLKYIGQGAFSGTGINEITIPETVEIIGVYPDRVGATSGAIFYYPATDPLTDEPVCVFDSDCIINGWYNTEAHRYALEWGLKFNPMDEDIAYGDTNLDGEVNIADMVLLQSYLKGNVSEIGYEADLLSDGIVDSFDMIKMRSNVLTQTAK